MLDKNADATEGGIRRFLRCTSCRGRILLTLARLFMRHVDLLTMIIRFYTKIASIHPDIAVDTPIDLWRELLLEHAVIMVMTTKGSPKKDDELLRQGHHRVFQRMGFFFPL